MFADDAVKDRVVWLLMRNLEAKEVEEEEVEDRMDRRGVLMAEARNDMTLELQVGRVCVRCHKEVR